MSGRKTTVKTEDILKVISKHIHQLTTSDLPPLSSELWNRMSKDLGGIWKPKTCYLYVRGNKNGHLTQVLETKGIQVAERKTHFKRSCSSESTKCDNSKSSSESSFVLEKDNRENLEIFHVFLSAEEWQQIKPEEHAKNRLRKCTWTSVINNAIQKRYNFPCAFNFKFSQISEHEGNYLKFVGFCSSKKCGNQVSGCGSKKPINGEHLDIEIKTVDTRTYPYHERVYTSVRGEERKKIGEYLSSGVSAEQYVDKLVRENMKFGEDMPTNIRPNHIYRQLKMETSKIQQGLKPKEKCDITKAIQKMAIDPQYDDAIQELGSIHFFVIYFTKTQIHVYREYIRTMGEKAEIAIDATGKFIKKIEMYEGKTTGHIFLYTVTINVDHKTVPVCQMVTESHDTGFITFWLDRWLRAGVKAPPQAISDYGRAILLGMCRSFNNMTIKSYIDACFRWANADESTRVKTRPAKTIIRVDVAHLIALVSRWECIKKTAHPDVKRFFLRTVALMIDCQEINEFGRVFSLTCAVALNPYDDELVDITGKLIKIKEARTILKEYMSKRDNIICQMEETNGPFAERADDMPESTNYNCFDDDDAITSTHKYIKAKIASVRPNEEFRYLEGETNAYFLPDFVSSLENIAKEFPLWTAAAIPGQEKHASTAYQEGYFATLRRVLKNSVRLPTTAHKFIHEHIIGIQTGTMMVSSNLKHINHLKRQIPLSQTTSSIPTNITERKDDSDLLSFENWGGLAKKSKYMSLSDASESSDNEWPPVSTNQNQSASVEKESESSFYKDFKIVPNTSPYRTSSPYFNNVEKIESIKNLMEKKEKQQQTRKKAISKRKGYYFEKAINLDRVQTKKVNLKLLKNGSILPAVKSNKVFYKIVNTCGFDAIVHLVYLSAIHNTQYLHSIESSSSLMLQFILNFIKLGPSSIIYKQRLELLRPHYKQKNDFTITPLHPHHLDATDSIGGLIKKFFSSSPSVKRQKQCSSPNCGVMEVYREEELLGVNHRSFGQGFEGFKTLQNSVIYKSTNPVKCQIEKCSGLVTEETSFNNHVWIELDIRPNLDFNFSLECTLDDFPDTLKFTEQYRLAGVIAKVKSADHFVAYFKKITETGHTWLICDDLKDEITACHGSVVLIPMAAFYIRANIDNDFNYMEIESPN